MALTSRKKSAHHPPMIPYSDAVITLTPDEFIRASSIAQIQEVVQQCCANNTPLTVSAARTSMTGASVTDRGVLMSVENLNRIIALDEEAATITVEPGVILGEMQRFVESRGFFYPPSPTSRNECTVGATIATNATGDTTFKYGTTRRYVREITVVTADGQLRKITRKAPPPEELKNTAGYFLGGEEIDYFIGSEGTLGIIVEAKLALTRRPDNVMTFMIPFQSNHDALQFIASSRMFSAISPRTMEFVDESASRIMGQCADFPPLPNEARAFVICQQEMMHGSEDDHLDHWFSALHTVYTQCQSPQLAESIIAAQSDKDQARIAKWRHHIPATIAEQHCALQSTGGGKVGTDWWVPLPRMLEMMAFAYAASDRLDIPYIAFGHLGNGHPHFNYLTRSAAEKKRAHDLVLECCRKAVTLGGGVAGEHGIGKIKHELLAIQHPPHMINEMKALKSKYDPHWILAPGNIFNSPST